MSRIFSKTTLLILIMAVLAWKAPEVMLVAVAIAFFAKQNPEKPEKSDETDNDTSKTSDYAPTTGAGFGYGLHDTSGTNPTSAYRS